MNRVVMLIARICPCDSARFPRDALDATLLFHLHTRHSHAQLPAQIPPRHHTRAP